MILLITRAWAMLCEDTFKLSSTYFPLQLTSQVCLLVTEGTGLPLDSFCDLCVSAYSFLKMGTKIILSLNGNMRLYNICKVLWDSWRKVATLVKYYILITASTQSFLLITYIFHSEVIFFFFFQLSGFIRFLLHFSKYISIRKIWNDNVKLWFAYEN